MRDDGDVRCSVVLAVAVASSSAFAEPEATRLFEEGRALAKRGDYVDACNLFTQSFALDPAAGTELNLGDCHEHLGHLVEAWHHFDEASRKFAEAKDARARFARERRDAITPRLGTVVVHLADPTVHVTIAGHDEKAAREMRVQVDPGDIEVRAGAALQHVQVAPGGTATVDVGTAAVATMPVTPAAGERRQDRRWIAYTLLGGGLATGVLGVTLGVIAHNDYVAEFDSHNCMNVSFGTPVCNPAGLAAVERARTIADVGTGLGIVSVLSLAAGTIVYFTAPRDRIVVTPTASSSGAALVVSGSF